MSTQRIDYVRQNIEKFVKKTVLTNDKQNLTPTRSKLMAPPRMVNDENNPNNIKIKSSSKSNSKQQTIMKSDCKKSNSKRTDSNTASLQNRMKIKTNLINKIVNTKTTLSSVQNHQNVLSNVDKKAKQISMDRALSNNLRRLSNETSNKQTNNKTDRLSCERRFSNEKAMTTIVDGPVIKSTISSRLSSERGILNEKSTNAPVVFERQTSKGSNDKVIISKTSNDKITKQLSVMDKPTRSLAINLNEDQQKYRLASENELLKLKYLNAKCEIKLSKQNQAVIDAVKSIHILIEKKQQVCLELEQQLALKDTLLSLQKLSTTSLNRLQQLNMQQIECYLELVSDIINSTLSTVKVFDLKNANCMNDILKMTIAKLTSNLTMQSVQEFSNKLKKFDLVNSQIEDSMKKICLLKTTLIDEMSRRNDLKNIYEISSV